MVDRMKRSKQKRARFGRTDGISRRGVLKAGSAAAFAAPALSLQSARAQNDDFDVIVIGAGIAGLAAARYLSRLGYFVVVLEAAPEIGGRIRTDWSLGAPFEVGAGWIHRPEKNPISDLASKINAPTFVTRDDSFEVFGANGIPVSRKTVLQKEKELRRIYKRIDDSFDQDQPLSEAIGRVSKNGLDDPVLRWMASAYTEFSTGAPLDRLSGYYFDEDEEFWGEDVILTEGYDRIPASLADGLDIRLNTLVDTVEYEEGDGAAVYTSNGTFESDFVICTVPLGVLKAGAITFDPPLPASHTQPIEKLGFGTVTKLALKFDEPFWPLETQYFGLMTEELGRWNYFLNYRTFSPENILLGVSVGAYAEEADRMSDAEMTADGIAALRDAFGSTLPDPIDVLATRWSQDPLTLGAYSYTAVGNRPATFDALAKPVAGTVLLAGEHTNFAYHGTTHGAYLSGLWAAEYLDEELAE